MKELVELIPPSRDSDRAVSRMPLVEWKMSAENGDLMYDDHLVQALQMCGSDSKLAILLTVWKGIGSPAEITWYLNKRSENGEPVVSESLVKHFLSRASNAGYLDREQQGKFVTYRFPPWSDTFKGQVGQLADFSSNHTPSVGQIFSEAPKRSAEYSSSRLYDTVQTIRSLYESTRGMQHPHMVLPDTTSSLAREIGISEDAMKRQLRNLSALGFFSYNPVDTGNGAYQKYAVATLSQADATGVVSSKQEEGLQTDRLPLQAILRGFYQIAPDIHPDGFTHVDAFGYVLSQLEDKHHPTTDEERVRLYEKVRKAIMSHASYGKVLPCTVYERKRKSSIRFDPRTGQLQLTRNLRATLIDMQREDVVVEKVGLKLGDRIVRDMNGGFQRIINKAQADNIRSGSRVAAVQL